VLAVGAIRALVGDVVCDIPTRAQRPDRRRFLPAAAGLARVLLLASALATATVATATVRLAIPTGMPTGKTVTATQLWEEFDRALPPGVWVSPLENTEYEVISAQWMRRSFLPALQGKMKDLWGRGIPSRDSASNCSGFALVCRLMLGLSAMEARARAPATATVIVLQNLPFGGLDATLENHCVAFVLTDEGPWIIEVQSGEYVALRDYPNLATVKLVSVH